MKDQKIELPPLPKYTLLRGLHTSENMQAYARAAIEPYKQRIEELEAELQELHHQWVEHDTLGCPTEKTGIYAIDRTLRVEENE